MSEDKAASGGPFDLEKVQQLIELMGEHDLTEVTLRRGNEKWSLRRGPREVMQMAPPPGYPPPPPPPPPPGQPPAPAEQPAQAEGVLIKSPTVGTYYEAPSPDDPPFVKVGAKVQPETIVCIVEAMKVFNQIPAEVSGTIVEVLVSNGDPVEFGQPLFRVKPD